MVVVYGQSRLIDSTTQYVVTDHATTFFLVRGHGSRKRAITWISSDVLVPIVPNLGRNMLYLLCS